MKTNKILAISMVAASALITGCASPDYYPANTSQNYPSTSSSYPAPSQAYGVSYGVVDAIEVTGSNSGGVGAGAVVGGLVGGLLGNQIGDGNGRTAATVAGAVGGAVVGNQVQQRNRAGQQNYAVRVRLDNGSYQTYAQDNVTDLQIGSRVRVDNGRVYRY